jgi:enoyl-CoA hydratase/carnithine racemase
MASRPPEGDWLGSPYLTFERRGSIAIVTVDRPHRRNALTASMYFGCRYAVDHVNRSPELAAMVLTGTGDVFIPGGDLGGDPEDAWMDHDLLGMDNVPFEAFRSSSKPIVSAVNGICQGGGLIMAMLSDVAVAGTHATFRAPEVFRGIADTNYSAILPGQIGIPRARDMLLTGRVVDAQTALEWGLVTRLCEPGEELEQAIEIAKQIARGAPRARSAVKREIQRQYEHYDKVSMVESLGSDEAVEGFRAFKEKRMPSWVPEDLHIEGRL